MDLPIFKVGSLNNHFDAPTSRPMCKPTMSPSSGPSQSPIGISSMLPSVDSYNFDICLLNMPSNVPISHLMLSPLFDRSVSLIDTPCFELFNFGNGLLDPLSDVSTSSPTLSTPRDKNVPIIGTRSLNHRMDLYTFKIGLLNNPSNVSTSFPMFKSMMSLIDKPCVQRITDFFHFSNGSFIVSSDVSSCLPIDESAISPSSDQSPSPIGKPGKPTIPPSCDPSPSQIGKPSVPHRMVFSNYEIDSLAASSNVSSIHPICKALISPS